MILSDLDGDVLTRVARKLAEPCRDRFMLVSKACNEAVTQARRIDLYEDIARPERTLKEMLPLPAQLLRPKGYDLRYRNVLNNLEDLNPPATRGPLWKFFEECASFYESYPRLPKWKRHQVAQEVPDAVLPFVENLTRTEQGYCGFGRWRRGDTVVLGRLVHDNLQGMVLTLRGPTSSSLCVFDHGKRTGYGLVVRPYEKKITEGIFRENVLHGPGKITNCKGKLIEGTFVEGKLATPRTVIS